MLHASRSSAVLTRCRLLQVNLLLLILLAVEGIGLTCAATAYVARLLRAVSAQRHGLAACFLDVPTGFVRALASKQVQVDDDEAEDSDSEAGDEAGDRQAEDDEGGKEARAAGRAGGAAAGQGGASA